MSNTKSFFVSKTWKNVMKYSYGIGASVVIMGALFKIMHWPGASLMLIIGLTVEAVIFLLSVTEPVSMEKDWSRVFPELDDGTTDDVGLYDLIKSGSSDTPVLTEVENAEIDKIRKSISVLSKNIDSLNQVIDGISADLTESASDSLSYKNSMKSLSKKMDDLNSKYDSVLNALRS